MPIKIKEIIEESISKILEDDDRFNSIQNNLYDEKNSKLHGQEIKHFLKVLWDKGIKIKSYLGQGYYGYAFLTEDGKTIKITTDKSEVSASEKLKNKETIHFPKIYNVFKITMYNEYTVYVILKEFVLHNKRLSNLIGEISIEFKEHLNEYSYQLSKTGIKYPHNLSQLFFELTDFKKEDINNLINYLKSVNASSRCIWYITELYSLYQEMKSVGLTSTDTRPANLGIKNKKLIFLDFGASDDESIPDWLEKQPAFAHIEKINENQKH